MDKVIKDENRSNKRRKITENERNKQENKNNTLQSPCVFPYFIILCPTYRE